jgi:hypothetical protein
VVGKGFGEVPAQDDPSTKMMAQAIASLQSAGVKKSGDQVESTIDKLR